jgi:hypothetical protein
LAKALLREPRWSIAAAAITPRESLTACSPFRLPALIFISSLRRIVFFVLYVLVAGILAWELKIDSEREWEFRAATR